MALNPELMKRRQRIQQVRGPEKSLGQQAPKSADEELKELLEQLLEETKLGSLFTMTLERGRLISSLFYAGFAVPITINTEIALAPLGASTVYLTVPPGTVLVGTEFTSVCSLPWWLTIAVWMDSEPPALPLITVLRHPDRYSTAFSGLVPTKRFFRLTLFNNHLVNPLNYGAFIAFVYMPEASWKMLEAIYLKPIAEYAQEKAEELTGRPYP